MTKAESIAAVKAWLGDPKHSPAPSAKAMSLYLIDRARPSIADIARQMVDVDDLTLALAVARQGIELAEAHRAPPEQTAIMRKIILHIEDSHR